MPVSVPIADTPKIKIEIDTPREDKDESDQTLRHIFKSHRCLHIGPLTLSFGVRVRASYLFAATIPVVLLGHVYLGGFCY